MADSTTVTIGEHDYLIERLPARKAWHVLRRLLPVLTRSTAALRDGLKLLRNEGADSSPPDQGEAGAAPTAEAMAAAGSQIADIFAAAGPIADALRDLTDEDSDYVMTQCLSACKRKAGQHWAPVIRDGSVMFQDISMIQQLELVFMVLRENLSDFFTELRGRFPAAGV